uniref:Uncharacterized protein n=1 Tax=Meloidogyne enterolobii TaxID=390850 RepID=A0A6V7W3K2_MELEN|nr:unnamed protein product [Meloidogyne enterolobii]
MITLKFYFIFVIILILIKFVDKSDGEFREKKFFETNKGKEGYICEKSSGIEYCSCLVKGKKSNNFILPTAAPACDEHFLKIALVNKEMVLSNCEINFKMPMCGNVWFDNIKNCALINFFEDKLFAESNFAKDRNKKFLILLDGCAICPSAAAKITGLRVTHFEKGGNWLSHCDDESEFEALSVKDLNIGVKLGENINLGSSSFSLPVILTHRICGQIFSSTVPDKTYTNIYLHITHNCGGKESVKKVLLPDINLDDKKFKFQVAEIRGLKVNLVKDEVKHYVRDGNGHKVIDQVPKVWEDAKVECWWKSTDTNCGF